MALTVIDLPKSWAAIFALLQQTVEQKMGETFGDFLNGYNKT